MFSQRTPRNVCAAVVVGGVFVLCVMGGGLAARDAASATFWASAQAGVPQPSPSLSLVRVFSSAEDVRREHPILDRTLDIIAGPADPETRVDALQFPAAVVTDSSQRVFVADPGAKTVHIFDFVHSKYDRLDRRGDRLHSPIALAVDGQDNLYVVDQSSRTVLVYDSAGKFRHNLGKLRGGESYFDSPAGIAIDKATGHVYVCDRQRHMIVVMDQRGKIIRKLGNRGGGKAPGEFRYPSAVAVAGGELFVVDAGNTRIQVFDSVGHFLRVIRLAYTDRSTSLAADNQGNIYVSDPILNQVHVIGHDGQMLHAFDLSTIKGANVSHPAGMWMDSHRSLYVVDAQSKRVGEFQINGEDTPQ